MLGDFAFCLGVCAPDAAIVFHDAGSTRPGIRECLRLLRRSAASTSRTSSSGNTFVIALWGSPVGSDLRVRRMAVAVRGERWLWTSSVYGSARRRVPDAEARVRRDSGPLVGKRGSPAAPAG